MQALYTFHLTTEHQNSTPTHVNPTSSPSWLRFKYNELVLEQYKCLINSKTKWIQTKEIHETPDRHVVGRSTIVQQFLHWKDVFTLVLGLIPVTADAHQKCGE
jgi:hypothetical protein